MFPPSSARSCRAPLRDALPFADAFRAFRNAHAKSARFAVGAKCASPRESQA
jgi:hypothetical protein